MIKKCACLQIWIEPDNKHFYLDYHNYFNIVYINIILRVQLVLGLNLKNMISTLNTIISSIVKNMFL